MSLNCTKKFNKISIKIIITRNMWVRGEFILIVEYDIMLIHDTDIYRNSDVALTKALRSLNINNGKLYFKSYNLLVILENKV